MTNRHSRRRPKAGTPDAPPPLEPPRARGFGLGAIAVFLLAVGLYLPALHAPLVLDDLQFFFNPDIRDLRRLPALFAHGYWTWMPGAAPGDLYRPVTTVSLNLSYAVGGDRPEPMRAANLMLHGATAVLVARLALVLLGSVPAAVAAGVLHAVLPVHADTAIGVVHRAELLAAALALAAVLLHLKAGRAGRPPAAAAVVFALAVLSKESAAALPAALLLLDFVAPWQVSWSGSAVLKRYGPHALALGACLALRVAVLGKIGLNPAGRYFATEDSLVVLLTMAGFAFLHYLRPVLLGAPLIFDFSAFSFPTATIEDPSAWGALAFFGALAAVAGFRVWRRRSLASAAVLLTFVLVVPVSNLIVRAGIVGAHRVLYLPAVGFALLVGVVTARVERAQGLRRWLGRGAVVAVLGFYAATSLARQGAWRDTETLYRATIEAVPGNALITGVLGAEMLRLGRPVEAEALLRQARPLTPGSFPLEMNLADALARQGRTEEALMILFWLRPEGDRQRALVLWERARVLLGRGGPGDAEHALANAQKASEMDPEMLLHDVTVAEARVRLGQRDEARALLDDLLRRPAQTDADMRAQRDAAALLGRLDAAP